MLDPANVRAHDARNLEAIKASLARFGQQTPIVVNAKGIIVAGNARMMAAKMLNWSSVEIVRTELVGAEAIAYAIADNRTAELAEWDEAALAQQLAAIQIDDEELANIAGFTDAEIEAMILDGKEIEEDEVPEPPVDPITKTGDLWLLGDHRLLCGDSTNTKDVERVMAGEKAALVFTDPPYGMQLDTDYTAMGSNRKYATVIGDMKQFDASHLLTLFSYCDEVYLFGADYYSATLRREYPNLGSWVVWDKMSDDTRSGLMDGKFGSAFELCWSKAKHKREIVRVLVTTNYTARGDETRVHPTQKPVALAAWFLSRRTKAAGLVADPYLGSGTTLIAAEQLGRKCYGMEISPQYCDVIVKRWESLTGRVATLSTENKS